MNDLTQQLAHALAQAVKDETEKAERYQAHELIYVLPDWFHDAGFALAEFARQREQELMDRNRIY